MQYKVLYFNIYLTFKLHLEKVKLKQYNDE